MISSMTGYGKGVVQTPSKRIQIEIKSVNSKQLDLSIKLPLKYKELEVMLRNPIAKRLGRGKVELWANVENLDIESGIEFNYKIIADYKNKIDLLSRQLNISQPSDWYSVLLRLPEVIKSENSDLSEEEIEAFKKAVEIAVNSLVDFRKAEGEKLFSFFKEKILNIKSLLEKITPYEEERLVKIRVKLEENLKRIEGIEYDKGRLEQELIFYIEKLDVTEEKTRLLTHLSYFLETLDKNFDDPAEAQGRKLGFIAQEMGREINTLGSKANHAEMQKIVVMMKDELEQIKEQVLNIL